MHNFITAPFLIKIPFLLFSVALTSPYFTSSTSSNTPNHAETTSETLSNTTRGAMPNMRARKIPKTKPNPTIFGGSWTETTASPKATIPAKKKKNEFADLFEYTSDSKLIEERKRYRRIIEKINATTDKSIPTSTSVPPPSPRFTSVGSIDGEVASSQRSIPHSQANKNDTIND